MDCGIIFRGMESMVDCELKGTDVIEFVEGGINNTLLGNDTSKGTWGNNGAFDVRSVISKSRYITLLHRFAEI
jgi:hypothetical protein